MKVNTKREQKVAIIGAGVIGINCAFELQSLGYQTTIFDPSGISEQCSKGNAGHFATEQVFPLADPGLLPQLPKMLLNPQGPFSLSTYYLPKALPWFFQFMKNMLAKNRLQNIKALKSINENAINYYQQLLSRINAEHLLTCNGSLLVFEHTPLATIEKIARQYINQGIAVQILNKHECNQLEPELADSINYAIYFTDVAHTINPHNLCLAIAGAAFSLGSKLIKEKIENISCNESVVTLQTNQSIDQFDHVVIATGAWSKPLINTLGYRLPLEAERGYHYQFDDSIHLSRPIVSAERKFIITPMETGLRVAGTVEFSGLNAKPNYKRAQTLKQQAKLILKSSPNVISNNNALHQWQGDRPSLPDSLPVICRAPNHSNIYFSFGHQHLGLTLGAITGKLIGQIISDQKTDIDISPYCISRFN